MELIHTKKNGGLAALAKKLLELKKTSIEVGILKDTNYPESGASLLTVAMTQEFGSAKRGIPARKPLRGTAMFQKNEVQKRLKSMTKKCLESADVKTEANKIGAWFAGEVKRTVRAGGAVYIPNAKSTINKKGENKPLLDSGLMMRSYTWRLA
jgi:hypothetical protein